MAYANLNEDLTAQYEKINAALSKSLTAFEMLPNHDGAYVECNAAVTAIHDAINAMGELGIPSNSTESDGLNSTESLTELAMLNALNSEAELNGIDPVAFQNHEPEIRKMLRKLIVASRN
jgi:hypothetical protein